MSTIVLETCEIPPPPGTPGDVSLPLSFLDLFWIHSCPSRGLLFYDHPCSKIDFLETLVPKLKQSLSLALKHYFPVAGNLLYPNPPIDDKKPIFRYLAGDSVSLTIAESTCDFTELIANHARDAHLFYDFVPLMSQVKEDPTPYKVVPVISLQVTLFPGRGICIGNSYHHCIGDGRSFYAFTSAWASINKLGEKFVTPSALPVFDRSVIKDPLGVDAIYWNVMKNIPFDSSKVESLPVPMSRVYATFALNSADINKLKDLVLEKKPSLVRVSSFVVTMSYVWSCLAKSTTDQDHESQVFKFGVDARGRLSRQINPPAPQNYFGNCISPEAVIIERRKLVGEEGFVIAAEAITKKIQNIVNNKDEILKEMENWLSEKKKFLGVKGITVSGSPKFDLTFADFGWGKARNIEVSSHEETISLCNCKNLEGLEVGLLLPKERMESFAIAFADGLSQALMQKLRRTADSKL